MQELVPKTGIKDKDLKDQQPLKSRFLKDYDFIDLLGAVSLN